LEDTGGPTHLLFLFSLFNSAEKEGANRWWVLALLVLGFYAIFFAECGPTGDFKIATDKWDF